MTNSEPNHILLTGATGFLGHYLLAAILRRTAARCSVLLRPPLCDRVRRLGELLESLGVDLDPLMRTGRVLPIEATLPDAVDVRAAGRIDLILHAAAATNFQADTRGEPWRTNVAGTRALVELADALDIRRFLLISTAYVCGQSRGVVRETLVSKANAFNNDYEASKWEAERLVGKWSRDGRVATICRPAILFGDINRGRTTQIGGVYVLARAMEVLARAVADDTAIDRHRVPLRIPGRPDATVNLVPVCWAADRIVDVLMAETRTGGVYHLTNADPPTHGEIKLWLETFFDLGGGSFTNETWPWPNPTRFEDALFAVADPILQYFRCDLSFASSINDAHQPRTRLVDRALFLQSMRFLKATQWGRKPDSNTAGLRRPFDLEWYFKTFMARHLPNSTVARIEALTATVRFVIEDVMDEEWVCRFDNGLLTDVGSDGHLGPVDFGYRIQRSSFVNIVTGRSTPQREFYDGAANLAGDQLKALKMVPIIESFIREFPVTSN